MVFLICIVENVFFYYCNMCNFYNDIYVIFNKYIYKQFMDGNIYTNIITTYIGVTALIVAIGIFVMDKGDIDNRSLFKKALIKKSNISELIKYIVITFLLILGENLIIINIIKFIIRIVILSLTIIMTIKIGMSFKEVIEILTDEEKKEKIIDDEFKDNIKSAIIKNKKAEEISEKSKNEILNRFNGKEIEYNAFFWNQDEKYYEVRAKHEGIVKVIHMDSLAILVNDIKKYRIRKKIDNIIDEENKEKYVIITKLEGDDVKENDSLLFIRKDIIDELKIKKIKNEYDKYFFIECNRNSEQKVIKKRIIDSCKNYVSGINNKNIYEIDEAKIDIIHIYNELVQENALNEICFFDENIHDIYINYPDANKIQELYYQLAKKSIKYGLVENFQNYLYIYIYNRMKNIKEVELIFQDIMILKSRIEDEENLNYELKVKFTNVLIGGKFKVLKKLFDEKKYNKILEKNDNKKNLIIFNLNRKIKLYYQYKNNPGKYINFNINENLNQLKKQYDNELEKIVENNTPYLFILEWARYMYSSNKNALENEEIKSFINEIINSFKYYNVIDVIEFFQKMKEKEFFCCDNILNIMEIDNNEYGKVCSMQCSIDNVFLLLLFKCNIEDSINNYKLTKYINKNYLQYFKSIKDSLGIGKNECMKLFDLNEENYLARKQKLDDYFNNIVIRCQNDMDSDMSKHIIKKNKLFKDKIVEALEKNKKENSLFSFFKRINGIEFDKCKKENTNGYCMNYDKEYLEYDIDKNIENIAEEFAKELINYNSSEIIKKISENSIEKFDIKIDDILKEIINKGQIFIITPYISNEFNDKYQIDVKNNKKDYLYGKYKIPIIEQIGYDDEIIIGDKDSFGKIVQYEIKDENGELNGKLADAYTIASFIDYADNDDLVNEIIENENKKKNNSMIDDEKEKLRIHLKTMCRCELYQSIEYKPSENPTLYKIKMKW